MSTLRTPKLLTTAKEHRAAKQRSGQEARAYEDSQLVPCEQQEYQQLPEAENIEDENGIWCIYQDN